MGISSYNLYSELATRRVCMGGWRAKFRKGAQVLEWGINYVRVHEVATGKYLWRERSAYVRSWLAVLTERAVREYSRLYTKIRAAYRKSVVLSQVNGCEKRFTYSHNFCGSCTLYPLRVFFRCHYHATTDYRSSNRKSYMRNKKGTRLTAYFHDWWTIKHFPC